jgi:hypothetical protein
MTLEGRYGHRNDIPELSTTSLHREQVSCNAATGSQSFGSDPRTVKVNISEEISLGRLKMETEGGSGVVIVISLGLGNGLHLVQNRRYNC